MNIFNLLRVLSAIIELCCSIIYFIVYYTEYHICENITEFEHLSEIVLVLSITGLLSGLSSFSYGLCIITNTVRSLNHYITEGRCITNAYTKSFVCYRILSILLSLCYGIATTTTAFVYASIYFCKVLSLDWDAFCNINPHIMFNSLGYNITTAILVFYFLYLPCLAMRLVPLGR